MKKSITTPLLALFVLLTAATTISAGCNYIGGVSGNGNVIKQDRSVGSFTAIDVSSAFKVYLTQGTTNSVTVEADENLLPIIETKVEGSTLKISVTKPVHHFEKANIYITFTTLNSIDASGAVDLYTQGKITGTELGVDLSGASEAELNLAYNRVKIDGSGASKIKLTGNAENASVDFSGSGKLFAFDYAVTNMEVDISGAGEAEVNVTGSLNTSISGSGNIRYKGNPVIKQEISGAGSIKKAE
jgi:hypothetical protein